MLELETIQTIVLTAVPLILCGICILGGLIVFGLPALVLGALRARAGKGSKESNDFHHRAFMQP